ncbi:MAG: phosphopantothenoylcysteine decarboxylase/phosphopantothenate--cysteine ligase [Paracoccaceae bacterium]|jgi:phosphopantothenoylcysteine decarboxylase/phosphopantothenate--cysteine ligase
MQGKRILLIIGGGIAAYKSLDLIRKLVSAGAQVTPVLTKAGQKFVTLLSVGALAGNKVYSDLFDLTDEAEMGHIELSRSADLIVVAPATADLMAKMASGLANDLASTLFLATDKKVLLSPSMNVRMWFNPATQRNLSQLLQDGHLVVGPNEGDMACGEYGPGRMAEPLEILAAINSHFADGTLAGRHVIVTSGPTHEPIDPVRYIANRSSGAQGTAIARALIKLGARVSFITGPAQIAPPLGAQVIKVETAAEMHKEVFAALPADIAVLAAAVADWRVANKASSKLKKNALGEAPILEFSQNLDILAELSQLKSNRPTLVVGFAAETNDVVANAQAKRTKKGCDWILANDVRPQTGIMGGNENAVTLVTAVDIEAWPRQTKDAVGQLLATKIATYFGENS